MIIEIGHVHEVEDMSELFPGYKLYSSHDHKFFFFFVPLLTILCSFGSDELNWIKIDNVQGKFYSKF